MDYYVGNGIITLMVVLLVRKIFQAFKEAVWRPYALTRFFKKQGIAGPPYSGSVDKIKRLRMAAARIVLDTNSHDIVPRVSPHFHKWSSQYGKIFLYWEGQPRLIISDPELAKEILSSKFWFYKKPFFSHRIEMFSGKGVASLNGSDWQRHRKILNPAFSMDKLKLMVDTMATSTISMLEEWTSQAKEGSKTIEMMEELEKLTSEIIGHAGFGISYEMGKEAFHAQKMIQRLALGSHATSYIPGNQYLPTASNRQLWKLDKKLRSTLRGIVERRLDSKESNNLQFPYGDDLVGILIAHLKSNEPADTSYKLTMDEIVEECKTFVFTGHDTISKLLTWSIFMLSSNPEWQAKLREEVLRECGMKIPDADMLSKLKLMHMFFLEVLRLYSPVVMIMRQASEDMKLGSLTIPKHTRVVLPILMIHHDKDYWGEDANEFNPLRFKDGISKASKCPNAFLSFIAGPRVCIGQNFAMLEARTVISVILQRFSLSLSPEYKHTPISYFILQPQSGLPVIVKPLNV
ncbi:Cytochrome P450 [Corchorus capsularis]|uniref:Cytochrome P450 n=1 Tax=Corchorus capsularis TaxID=210143 RepID=A0A1R3H1H4_COCAP|nr:Cytochrome P450 [Corchorus capsularis]